MSRTGSFPLAVALSLLERFGEESSTVLDPFCGKGTTLLAGRLLGRRTFGLDVAPEAVVCTTAKLVDADPDGIQAYIERLPLQHHQPERVPTTVRTFFHQETLRQLLSIRLKLTRDARSSRERAHTAGTFTLATLLGILHGHAAYSLSIPSAHAYSMSPAYVRRYAREHGLRKPRRDVKACLAAKASRCLSEPIVASPGYRVKLGSVLSLEKHFPDLLGQIDLVLTSPPYLNAQTYAKDNWLRLWLLGYDYRDIKHAYLQTGSPRGYTDLMTNALRQIGLLLRPGGRLILIAGDVLMRRPIAAAGKPRALFSTGQLLADLCSSKSSAFCVEGVEKHSVASGDRYLHSLSATNGHAARRLVETVIVVRKKK